MITEIDKSVITLMMHNTGRVRKAGGSVLLDGSTMMYLCMGPARHSAVTRCYDIYKLSVVTALPFSLLTIPTQ
jgi:hypothetical protein